MTPNALTLSPPKIYHLLVHENRPGGGVRLRRVWVDTLRPEPIRHIDLNRLFRNPRCMRRVRGTLNGGKSGNGVGGFEQYPALRLFGYGEVRLGVRYRLDIIVHGPALRPEHQEEVLVVFCDWKRMSRCETPSTLNVSAGEHGRDASS